MNLTKQLYADRFLVSHTVGSVHSGQRLDAFLRERYQHRSRARIKKDIEKGDITLKRSGRHQQNLGRLKASFLIQRGDTVEVLTKKRKEPSVSFDYKILYQDKHLFVIEKPAYLPVHPAGIFFFNTLLTHLQTEGFTKPLDADHDFYLAHRIDKETSGILVLARTKEVCADLVQQFFDRKTEKHYLAIIHGHPSEDEFAVEAPLGRKPTTKIRIRMLELPVDQGGLVANTKFKVQKKFERYGKLYSLLECSPKTGRQHQIRAHLEIAGHPIVGDKIYGLPEEIAYEFFESDAEIGDHHPIDLPDGRNISEDLMARLVLKRHALHAARLKLKHPISQKMMEFKSELPQDLSLFVDG